jgi:hypothetical protein
MGPKMEELEKAQGAEDLKALNSVVLIVHLEDDEVTEFRKTKKFCCKPESDAALIRRFCAKKKDVFPYDEPFVSIAVYRPDEDICASRATIYGDSGALRKNCYVTLHVDRVLARIGVVARDDFRQLAVEIANRQKRDAPYDSKKKQLRDMRKLDVKRRIMALLWSTRGRGSHEYSEARLKGCLAETDVKSWHRC